MIPHSPGPFFIHNLPLTGTGLLQERSGLLFCDPLLTESGPYPPVQVVHTLLPEAFR